MMKRRLIMITGPPLLFFNGLVILAWFGYLPDAPVLFVNQSVSVIAAAFVALIPLFYPEYSKFSKNAENALDEFKYLRNNEGMPLNTIDSSVPGFQALFSVIESEYVRFPDHLTPVEMGHVAGSMERLNEFFEGEVALHPGTYDMIYVKTEGDRPNGIGNKTPVIKLLTPPSKPEEMPPNQLRRDIKTTAQSRANMYTAGLALIWSTISISTTGIMMF